MSENRVMTGEEWDRLIAPLPYTHLLQTWEWAQVKARVGWQAAFFTWSEQRTENSDPWSVVSGQRSGRGVREFPIGEEKQGENGLSGGSVMDSGYTQFIAAAMVLRRRLRLGPFSLPLCIMYVPKGPLLDWGNPSLRDHVLNDLAAFARQQGAIFIKIDPDLPIGRGLPGSPAAEDDPAGNATLSQLKGQGWIHSQDQIQFRNTMQINLSSSEEELLAGMKQKTRYNVRLAERKGVSIRVGTAEDFPLLYQMYAETSLRDGFAVREEAYYQHVWRLFSGRQESNCQPIAEPLIAEVDGEAVAGLIIFRFAGKAWYIYGMSRAAQREKMPNYLLQWEALRRAKAAGCIVYDLWGAPDEFVESDPMWGVFRFKEGLGGQALRFIGAWDLPLRPALYCLYTQTLPRVLNVMRRKGREATRRDIARAGG